MNVFVDRFKAKVQPDPASGCWNWTGAIIEAVGYGRFGMPGGVDYAHRAAWRLFRGEIPEGIHVCHRCDNRRCANPDHLFLGTRSDNMRDCSTKGRIKIPPASRASSEEHQVAILTNDQVREIRASALPAKTLWRSGKYPVGYQAVWAAKTGRTFRDVA